MSTRQVALSRQADQYFTKSEKVSSEVFAQTLFAFIRTIEGENEQVEAELRRVGRRMGLRMCDEMIAKAFGPVGVGSGFIEVVDGVVKVGMKIYFGLNVVGEGEGEAGYKFKLIGEAEGYEEQTSWMLSGTLEGVMSQLGFQVRVQRTHDNEFRVELESQ